MRNCILSMSLLSSVWRVSDVYRTKRELLFGSMNSSLYLQFQCIEFIYSHSLNYNFSSFSNFSAYKVNISFWNCMYQQYLHLAGLISVWSLAIIRCLAYFSLVISCYSSRPGMRWLYRHAMPCVKKPRPTCTSFRPFGDLPDRWKLAVYSMRFCIVPFILIICTERGKLLTEFVSIIYALAECINYNLKKYKKLRDQIPFES